MDRQRRGEPVGDARGDGAACARAGGSRRRRSRATAFRPAGAGPVGGHDGSSSGDSRRSPRAADQFVGRAGAALGLGQARRQRQHDLPVAGRLPGQARALGREIVLGGEMAGGEEFLEGAMREGELPLAIAFALAEQEAGALFDVVDDDGGLVQAVAEQRPETRISSGLADVGRGRRRRWARPGRRAPAFATTLSACTAKASSSSTSRRSESFSVGMASASSSALSAPICRFQRSISRFDRVVVEVGAVVGQAAAIGVQRRHQRQQQRVARQRQQVGRWRAASRSSRLRSASPGEQPLAPDQRGVPGADELSICSSSRSASA
jgi:hypothetical protein